MNRSFGHSRASMQSRPWLALLVAMAMGLAGATVASAQGASQHAHDPAPGKKGNSPLVDKVRAATVQFLDVNVPLGSGWVVGTPCVSGPNSGAMGVHVILPSRVGDGVLNASEPEALIYEPQPNGSLRLVGVEFIVLASDWASMHPEGGTPAVDGHLTNFVDEPNRYGLKPFYELHVWAWEHNPNGSFADWNTQVSCDAQPAS
jgi:hypothetical protein